MTHSALPRVTSSRVSIISGKGNVGKTCVGTVGEGALECVCQNLQGDEQVSADCSAQWLPAPSLSGFPDPLAGVPTIDQEMSLRLGRRLKGADRFQDQVDLAAEGRAFPLADR